jgi:hypothetical protein
MGSEFDIIFKVGRYFLGRICNDICCPYKWFLGYLNYNETYKIIWRII